MTQSTRRLLEVLLDRYDAANDPISVAELAAQLGTGQEVVRQRLGKLERYELVTSEAKESGYRPTVTGREFLELDLDDDDFFLFEISEGADQ